MSGSILSLGAAFFWAAAVILFKKSGETFSPISLNLYKTMVAAILIIVTMLILDIPILPDKPAQDWLLLAGSGLLGITVADILFFMALNRLGASLSAIVECLYLPSVLFFSFLFLGERLSTAAILGGLLVLTAVLVGSADNMKPSSPLKDRSILSGIIIGSLSIIFLSIGIIMIKELLNHTEVFWATLVRVTAGMISLLFLVCFHPKRRDYFRELIPSRAWFTAFPASLSGNYFALLCWVGGMKYTSASRAAIFNQMSTIFIFILAAIFLKEKITARKTAAIVLAVAGACLTLMG